MIALRSISMLGDHQQTERPQKAARPSLPLGQLHALHNLAMGGQIGRAMKEINVFKIVWAPIIALSATLAFLVPFAWTQYFREQIRPSWSPEMTYSGDIEDQRHMASCYESGCHGMVATPILACAWREVILEETNRSLASDVAASDKACGQISADQNSILERAETDIRARLHSLKL